MRAYQIHGIVSVVGTCDADSADDARRIVERSVRRGLFMVVPAFGLRLLETNVRVKGRTAADRAASRA